VLAGYHSSSLPIKQLHLMDNPDLGVILIRPNGRKVTAPWLPPNRWPSPNRSQTPRARAAGSHGRKDRSAKQRLEKAVAIYPDFAAAWCELGKLEVASGGLDSGRASFERALHADPKQVDPYLQLATVALWTESGRN